MAPRQKDCLTRSVCTVPYFFCMASCEGGGVYVCERERDELFLNLTSIVKALLLFSMSGCKSTTWTRPVERRTEIFFLAQGFSRFVSPIMTQFQFTLTQR